MECAICDVRSSIGFCVQCKSLLCEECSTTCDHCGKIMCEKHVHSTRHGRDLCIECMEERNRKRAERKHHGDRQHEEDEDTTFDGLQDAPDPEEEEEEDETLVISGYRATPPWLLSAYAAGGGILVSLIVLLFPALAQLAQPWSSAITIMLAAISIFWAVLGLRDKRREEDKSKCYYGLGAAGLVICLAILTLVVRPPRSSESIIEEFDDGRQDLSGQELEDWRKDTLDRLK